MKRLQLCFLAVVLAATMASGDERFGLQPTYEQGSLVIGQGQPGDQVFFQDKAIMVAPDGRFVFGVGRDEKGPLVVRLERAGKVFEAVIEVQARGYQIERIDGLPPKTVSPPPEWLARRREENGRVRKGRAPRTQMMHWAGGFVRPAVGRFSGFYGSQRILNGKPRTPHYGLDIAGPVGTPIIAPAAGVITLAAPDFLLEGGIVIIDHGFGVSSTLFHMDRIEVEEGQTVAQGEQIGLMGAKGRATGSHVDWRINWGSVRLDPALVLTGGDAR